MHLPEESGEDSVGKQFSPSLRWSLTLHLTRQQLVVAGLLLRRTAAAQMECTVAHLVRREWLQPQKALTGLFTARLPLYGVKWNLTICAGAQMECAAAHLVMALTGFLNGVNGSSREKPKPQIKTQHPSLPMWDQESVRCGVEHMGLSISLDERTPPKTTHPDPPPYSSPKTTPETSVTRTKFQILATVVQAFDSKSEAILKAVKGLASSLPSLADQEKNLDLLISARLVRTRIL
ncbi:hypothetical protein LXL04_039592 [Taraxacum kok-saghyz]